MLRLEVMTVGPYQMNCYLVVDQESLRGVLVDPGAQPERILQCTGSTSVTHILLTHGHPDHVGALDEVRRALGAPVGLHPADADEFAIEADLFLRGGDEIEIGGDVLRVVPIPGHTPGSVALLLIEGGQGRRAIVGDAVFPGGPGHTRTPEALALSLDSLQKTVFSWPDETVLFPGHGASTTVAAERPGFEKLRSGPLPPDLCGDVTWY